MRPRIPRLVLVLVLVLGPAACREGSDRLTPVPQFSLAPGGVPSSSAFASVKVVSERLGVALMNSSGGAKVERIVPFDPVTGALGVSVTARQTVAFVPPLQDDQGAPCPSTVTSFPAFAAAVGTKLYVTTSNLNLPSFAYAPGTVLVYDLNPFRPVEIGALRGAIVTAGTAQAFYNPTAIVPFTRTGTAAPLLAVVCSGSFSGTAPAAVVVIDPAADRVIESAVIGNVVAGAGEAAVGPDGRLYVGSSTASELFVVDLRTSPPAIERGGANPVVLPATGAAFFNLVPDLAVSADGARLFAVEFAESILTTLSLASPAAPAVVTQTSVFHRSSPTTSVQNNLQSLAVRPGRPGVDFFGGPDLVLGTINITRTQDQVVPDVRTAVDAATSYAGAAPDVKLNALVSPFTPGATGAIQHIEAPGGRLAGFFYVVEGFTGKVVVRRFDELR